MTVSLFVTVTVRSLCSSVSTSKFREFHFSTVSAAPTFLFEALSSLSVSPLMVKDLLGSLCAFASDRLLLVNHPLFFVCLRNQKVICSLKGTMIVSLFVTVTVRSLCSSVSTSKFREFHLSTVSAAPTFLFEALSSLSASPLMVKDLLGYVKTFEMMRSECNRN
ncbi:hypothetical protein F2Q69_00033317 [Brassica cretica]|uniref:Uncharacterized protein n=1 Tax=Brassica cretica TaxID=69181 RepID=A0A8S9S9E9_BRACR|nr:hypothetical protein F2Q69_00033317 [Brassica cretica]